MEGEEGRKGEEIGGGGKKGAGEKWRWEWGLE